LPNHHVFLPSDLKNHVVNHWIKKTPPPPTMPPTS
jgi:hypothetical protein